MYEFEYQGWKVPSGLNYKLDYIFISEDIKYQLPRIDENKISDHAPVIVDLEL